VSPLTPHQADCMREIAAMPLMEARVLRHFEELAEGLSDDEFDQILDAEADRILVYLAELLEEKP